MDLEALLATTKPMSRKERIVQGISFAHGNTNWKRSATERADVLVWLKATIWEREWDRLLLELDAATKQIGVLEAHIRGFAVNE